VGRLRRVDHAIGAPFSILAKFKPLQTSRIQECAVISDAASGSPANRRKRMLKRSRDLFRWARERRGQSGRFSEPSFFHQLSRRWDPAARHEQPSAAAASPERKNGLPLYWQKANSRPTDPTRTRG